MILFFILSLVLNFLCWSGLSRHYVNHWQYECRWPLLQIFFPEEE